MFVKGVNCFMILFKFLVFETVSCYCYGDYIKVCDCFIQTIVLIFVIGLSNCPITDCPIIVKSCPIHSRKPISKK